MVDGIRLAEVSHQEVRFAGTLHLMADLCR